MNISGEKPFYDPDNAIVQRCAEAMSLEGDSSKALDIFQQAWSEAHTDFEKFISAHYLARHQKNSEDKLKWDENALSYAMNIRDERVKTAYPSLYLNIGKGYEDLGDFDRAHHNYQQALSYVHHLSNDGYGEMISNGIRKGIERTRPVNR